MDRIFVGGLLQFLQVSVASGQRKAFLSLDLADCRNGGQNYGKENDNIQSQSGDRHAKRPFLTGTLSKRQTKNSGKEADDQQDPRDAYANAGPVCASRTDIRPQVA